MRATWRKKRKIRGKKTTTTGGTGANRRKSQFFKSEKFSSPNKWRKKEICLQHAKYHGSSWTSCRFVCCAMSANTSFWWLTFWNCAFYFKFKYLTIRAESKTVNCMCWIEEFTIRISNGFAGEINKLRIICATKCYLYCNQLRFWWNKICAIKCWWLWHNKASIGKKFQGIL